MSARIRPIPISCAWCTNATCARCRRWRRCWRIRVRGSRNPAFEVDFLKLLHGEQNLTVHRPLPSEGEIEANYRVPAVVDKGTGKGALVYFEKSSDGSRDSASRCAPFPRRCSCAPTAVAAASETPPPPLPDGQARIGHVRGRDQDSVNAALLYRLNGDLNPIHVDPDAARKAGFDRPILHGLCTYGVVGYLLDAHSLRPRSGAPPVVRRAIQFAGVPGRNDPDRGLPGCRGGAIPGARAGAQSGRSQPGLRANRLSCADNCAAAVR